MRHAVIIGRNVAQATRKRCLLFLLVLTVAATYLGSVIFRMQVSEYDTYRQKVLDQITTSSVMRARRGIIYDAQMNVLATSRTVWRVFLSPVDIAEHSSDTGTDYAALIAERLAPILHAERETLLARARQSGTVDVTVARGVDEETYLAVEALIARENLSDMLHTEASQSRWYPLSDFACHLLGFTGSDGQGLFGLEYQYDAVLRGTDGYYLYAKDAKGNQMPDGYVTYIEATDGQSLVTTIDSFLQTRLEYTLREIQETFDVQNRVTGIVMNVNTGAVLAMATTSSYDLNAPYQLDGLYSAKLAASGLAENTDEYRAEKNELLYTMWQNKAVSDTYEPGSTFKIITVCAGLETGAVSTANRYTCTGSLRVGGYNISCHKRTGHGTLTLAEGLQQSCNPAMMQISAATGASEFYRYVKAFGYLEKTGIDLPAEGTSIFHKEENLGTTELATASFGQRFKITPLQQITAISAVANGGYLVTPYVVEKILDPSGEIVYTHTPAIKRQVVSSSTAATVSAILEEGVSGDGGAKNAAVQGYKIAAKTGTSQKFDILDENGNSYLRIGSCVGYAPSDKAEIAILIVVDEPTTAKYGSMVAAPYVSDLMEAYLPYLGYESSIRTDTERMSVSSYVGMSPSEARAQAEKAGMTVRLVGEGDRILSQSPAPGTEVFPDVGCVILYTEGAQEEEVTLPSFVGMAPSSANALLVSLGLNAELAGVRNREIGAGAVVASQSLAAGTKVKKGTVVRLTFLYMDDED